MKDAALRLFRRFSPPVPVVAGATYWTVNGVNIFSANLVRELNRRGRESRVLLTEEGTDLITIGEALMPRPDDIPFDSLGLERSAGWGWHWGRMVSYLRERAPCIYIPNSDWRHSCVCPRLPNDVIVVGVVHSDDPLHYDHVRRIGHTWNAVVTVSRAVAERTAELCPALAERISTIPIGVPIPSRRPEPRAPSDRLRLIYHGVLKQHQKRVLDFPRIVEAAAGRGVPVELTIVGAGPDEAALRAAAAALVARGLIRFHGIAPPSEIGGLLAQHDVYVLASEFEGMPNALIEAMGRGCVPLATRMTSGIPELVSDGQNGFLVPIGDAEAFADRLHRLWHEPELRRRLSEEAFKTVDQGGFRIEDMAAGYEKVFEHARREAAARRFAREPGELSHPPAEVAGVSLFPVPLPYHEPGIGAFPTENDALDYLGEVDRARILPLGPDAVAGRAPAEAPVDGMPVFIACPIWAENGISLWCEDLARGLRAAGMDARVLLTEESTALVRIPGPRLERPDDIPFHELELLGADGWGARWGAMVRLLESAGPCFYLPNFDWRHACVTPLLSREVMVVGLLHGNEAAYHEQARRLGASWNAVVVTSSDVAVRLRSEQPELKDRLVLIPHGIASPSPEDQRTDGSDAVRVLLLVGPGREEASAEIASQLVATGLPVTAAVLGANAAALQATEARILLRPSGAGWLALCRAGDILVAFPGDWVVARMVLVAMGQGCIPVFMAEAGGGSELLEHEHTGLLVSDAQQAVAAALRLAGDAELRARLGRGARAAVIEHRYSVDRMVAAYLQLFRRVRARVLSGEVPERTGRIEPPPALIDGIGILPIEYTHQSDVGPFPTQVDAERFEAERKRATPA